ncbi:nucleotidyltransferase family protein [Nocardiopsis sp. NRRL B-16309]|uniref:nucleotidyltransferase family protein n=1 Tax=Nocardiopsis sp. NRRL B-16309 TaxID=1519494 RepID=UPI0006B06880|nr:nucleotidyltransferase family protein [Nocardiopsis sp. NRRL B-16309]KOX14240.1 hypothetical protein ADL05_16715 [Nocardiopsis sp. NRRL B-16309]
MTNTQTADLTARFHGLLGTEPDDPYWTTLRRADGLHHSVGHLLLSLWESDHDVDLSPAAEAVLLRQRARTEVYREQERRLRAAGVRFRVVKGQSIGDLYPEGMFRSQTDMDVVVDSPDGLWAAAELVRSGGMDDEVHLTLINGDTTELYVALVREAEDPFYDKPLSVEVSTALHFGDLDSVPLRSGVSDDPVVANILAVCEERFQRRFHPRDAVDLDVLSRALGPGRLGTLVERAEALRLLPELRELTDLAASVGLASPLDDLERPTPADVERERERRREARGEAAPELLFGVRLTTEPVTEASRSPQPLELEGHRVLLSPLGAFLLVTKHSVAQDQAEAALDAVRRRLRSAGDPGERVSHREGTENSA